MTVALLATGDEIIQGDTLNTNSQQIAQILHSEGLATGLQISCSDSETQMQQCLQFLAKNHDIIITTGGLGPTSDDRTRFALSRFTAMGLMEFPEAVAHINQRLAQAKLPINEGNKQQAQFPEGAVLLPSPYGTAMGCYYRWQEKILIMLPGPPRECLPMFQNYVLPLLQKTRHSDRQILKWRLFGVAEGQIAQQIDEALAELDCETGYRLEMPYVECKVKAKPSLFDEVRRIMEPIVSPHIIASTEQRASEALFETLIARQQQISICDEVTGGVLQTLLQHPLGHALISFQAQAGSAPHFHLQGLKEYWQRLPNEGKSAVSLHYHYGKMKHSESHQLPFFSSSVVYFAAEWLSFRLLHIINQLHDGIA